MTRAQELAKEHENWLFSIFDTIPSFDDLPAWAKEFTAKLYFDAIVHGYKHGWEEAKKETNATAPKTAKD